MLTTFFRALVFVICLGATAFAHADSSLTEPGLQSSANIAQPSIDPTTPDFGFHHPGLELVKSSPLVVDSPMEWDFPQLSDPQPANKHFTQKRQFDPALANSSRMASLIRHDPEEVQPIYQLAIELPVEPAPCLAKGYSVDFNEALDWMLTINPPSSRLSGWKESNLTFTVYQHHLLRA